MIFFNSIEAIFSNGPMALGKSTASMVLGIVECVVNIILLVVAIPFGVMAIGYSMITSSVFNCLLYFAYLFKLSRFNIFKCFIDSWDSILSTLVMGVIVYAIQYIPLPFYIVFTIQILVGVGVYFLVNKLIKNKALSYCLSLVKDMMGRKKKSEKSET